MHASYAPPNQKKQARARHRDQPVVCASCGRSVPRKSRGHLYCSTRCRKRGAYAENARTGVFFAALGGDTGLGTNPPKKFNKSNLLQGAKTSSTPPVKSVPAAVLEVEIIGGRKWRTATSVDGVVCHVTSLRDRR